MPLHGPLKRRSAKIQYLLSQTQSIHVLIAVTPYEENPAAIYVINADTQNADNRKTS